MIRAAGGVIVRDGEVLLVHRPKYDDWSLPKGSANGRRETRRKALREVEEETGLRCEIEESRRVALPRTRGAQGRALVPARCVDGEFEADDEVDEVAWSHSDRRPSGSRTSATRRCSRRLRGCELAERDGCDARASPSARPRTGSRA